MAWAGRHSIHQHALRHLNPLHPLEKPLRFEDTRMERWPPRGASITEQGEAPGLATYFPLSTDPRSSKVPCPGPGFSEIQPELTTQQILRLTSQFFLLFSGLVFVTCKAKQPGSDVFWPVAAHLCRCSLYTVYRSSSPYGPPEQTGSHCCSFSPLCVPFLPRVTCWVRSDQAAMVKTFLWKRRHLVTKF